MTVSDVADRVRRAWRSGVSVAMATDTVYGLVAPAADEDAVRRLFDLKQRPVDRRMAVLVADLDQAGEWIEVTPALRRLAERFWPGALTVVGERRPGAPPWVGDDATLAVRCPDDDLLRSLAAEVGPLAATSANRHGEPTPTDAAAVEAALPSVGIVVDGGVRHGEPSTVVAVDADGLVVLREGAIPAADISAVLGSSS